MRSLLVQGAHCILRRGAPESDLRDWGRSKLGSGGGKNAKRRTVVAVARKLAVLLHTLWARMGRVYDPLYNRKAVQAAQAKAKGKGKTAA